MLSNFEYSYIHTCLLRFFSHEIVGTAVRVGKNVKTVKVGDRVGVGAQIGSWCVTLLANVASLSSLSDGYLY
jgi:threonine dehydrogenase-like Zn-dependent dehydrogenase